VLVELLSHHESTFCSNVSSSHVGLSPGVIRLRQGDKLSVAVASIGDANYNIQHESGFFVALLHEE
jgi:hypothetical protein